MLSVFNRLDALDGEAVEDHTGGPESIENIWDEKSDECSSGPEIATCGIIKVFNYPDPNSLSQTRGQKEQNFISSQIVVISTVMKYVFMSTKAEFTIPTIDDILQAFLIIMCSDFLP